MNEPWDCEDGLLQRLREARRREMRALGAERDSPSHPPQAGEPLASAVRIHDSAQAVLARIDAAEHAMRLVLRAWETDPARRGAHLLPPGSEDAGAESEPEATAQPTWPADPAATMLPATVPASPNRP